MDFTKSFFEFAPGGKDLSDAELLDKVLTHNVFLDVLPVQYL